MKVYAATLLLALAGLVPAAGASAQSPPPFGDAAKGMIGSWEFSNADRDRICTATFSADRAGPGYKIEFDAKCLTLFPLVADIAAWTYRDNDLLNLVDGKGKTLIEFSEVESGIFEAPTPGLGVLFLQNAADAGPAPPSPEQIAGDWALRRGSGKPLCILTLTTNPAAEGFALTVKPGCDAAITRLGFNRWEMDRGELLLGQARGNAWRFESAEGDSWQRVPATSNPYTLVRP
jgi:hypothetical protein